MLGQAVQVLHAWEAEIQGDGLRAPGLGVGVGLEGLLPQPRGITLLQDAQHHYLDTEMPGMMLSLQSDGSSCGAQPDLGGGPCCAMHCKWQARRSPPSTIPASDSKSKEWHQEWYLFLAMVFPAEELPLVEAHSWGVVDQ